MKEDKVMTITEVLPTLKALNRKDKIKAIQFLADELVKEEEQKEVLPLHDSSEAAKQLQKLLDDSKVNE